MLGKSTTSARYETDHGTFNNQRNGQILMICPDIE